MEREPESSLLAAQEKEKTEMNSRDDMLNNNLKGCLKNTVKTLIK